MEDNPWVTSFAPSATVIQDSAYKIYYDVDRFENVEKGIISTEFQ